jgi:hypothetical protein
MTKTPNNSAARTREWRARRRGHPGGLVQVISWVPRDYVGPLRKIFGLLADPDWRGMAFRRAVAHWLYRRRPVLFRASGDGYSIEIDAPEIDDDRELIPIGGRVFGIDHTFVELTPHEAHDLNKKVQKAIGQVAQDFIASRGLDKNLRDRTGVLPAEVAPHHTGYRPSDMKVYDVDRPDSDAQFEAREAVVASEICATHEGVAIDAISDGLYEMRHTGGAGIPSRALLLVGKPGELGRTIDHAGGLIALIGLPCGGTPPTLVFAHLAKAVRENLLADIGDAPMRYLDVEPDEFSAAGALRISEVKPGRDRATLEWVPNPKIPFALNRGLRAALEDYRAWRGRGRLSVEDDEALTSLPEPGASV